MSDKTQIRQAITTEIEDLVMAAILRDCVETVFKHTAMAQEQMENENEPAALKALCNGIWALAAVDPWRGNDGAGDKRSG